MGEFAFQKVNVLSITLDWQNTESPVFRIENGFRISRLTVNGYVARQEQHIGLVYCLLDNKGKPLKSDFLLKQDVNLAMQVAENVCGINFHLAILKNTVHFNFTAL